MLKAVHRAQQLPMFLNPLQPSDGNLSILSDTASEVRRLGRTDSESWITAPDLLPLHNAQAHAIKYTGLLGSSVGRELLLGVRVKPAFFAEDYRP